MPLSLDSPRFSLRTADLFQIDDAIAMTGHAVITDVWDTDYLAALRRDADARFRRDDERFAAGFEGFPDSVVECYLGSFIGLENLSETDGVANAEADKQFFTAVELSGLPGVLRVLLKGDFFVGKSERVIRRADPRFPIRAIGLHPDGQLRYCSGHAFNTRRELTTWTPLQDCTTDGTPRLLLMHKGETYTDLFAEEETPAIERRRKQIRNEAEVAGALKSKINQQYDELFQHRHCFAPYVPFGSSIIFEAGVFHASYMKDGMTIPRFSLDFRSVGDFQRTAANRTYVGRTYRAVPIELEMSAGDMLLGHANRAIKRVLGHAKRAIKRVLGHLRP